MKSLIHDIPYRCTILLTSIFWIVLFSISDVQSQNVGINQPNPIWPLDISAPQGVIRLLSTAATYGSTLELRNMDATAEYLGAINFNDPAALYPGQISYKANHTMSFRVGQYERMTIDNNGRIGIGTQSPAHILDVSHELATLRLTANNNGDGANIYLANDNSSGNPGTIYFVDEGFTHGYIVYTGDGTMAFYTNNNSRLRINSAGLIGIGTVPSTNSLEVSGNASKSIAGDWLANSDARLKKNIKPLDSQTMLDQLLMLQGVTYEWNDDKTGYKRPVGNQYGFIAQNIEKVFPTLVEEDNLGYLQTAYGTYDPMIVEAIRALNEKITSLEREVERLRQISQK